MTIVFQFDSVSRKRDASYPITFDDAKVMHTKYLLNPLKVKINSTHEDLKGFSFDKDDILKILNREGMQIDRLFILFGANSEGHVKLIAGGIDKDNNNLQPDRLYDMCDPCPDQCPANIKDFRNT